MANYFIRYLLYYILVFSLPLNNKGFIVRSSSYGNLQNLLQKNNINDSKLKINSNTIDNKNNHKSSLKLFKDIDDYNEFKNILIDIKNINKIYFSHKNNRLLIIYNNNTRNSYYVDDNIKIVLGNSIYSSFLYIFKEFINEYIHHIFVSLFH